MSYLTRRKGSQIWWFKMDVPQRHRAAIGKTAWWQSLDTADQQVAEARASGHAARYKTMLVEIDGKVGAARGKAVVRFVDEALATFATACGGEDQAIAFELTCLALHVANSWSFKRVMLGAGAYLGDEEVIASGAASQPPAFDSADEHYAFELRGKLIEGRGIADGLVYREVAQRLLDRGELERAYPLVINLASGAADPFNLLESAYGDVARAYLGRLADHSFASWPNGVLEALAPLGQSILPVEPVQPLQPAPSAAPLPTPIIIPSGSTELRAKRLSQALDYWRRQRTPGASAIREATRSVQRFVDLYGDLQVGSITRDHVIAFRDMIMDLPPQTELEKVKAAGGTLRQVIEKGRERRQDWEHGDRSTPEPERLAAGSIKKDIGGLSAVLSVIAEDAGDGVNPAANIRVPGYSKTKKGQKRPRFSFTPEMMQTLFDSPLFTGCAGPSDTERTRPGPYIYQDELYWAFLFGVVGGPRLKEIGQIALDDVHACDLRRTFGDEYEGKCLFVHITGSGEGQSVKNDESDRYVVLHDRLVDLGFAEYISYRRAAGTKRLFDLTPNEEGDLTKGLSQRLNRYLDRVVTSDPRYVFHSTRHEFTDRAELSGMPARVANSIKGHANATVGDNYGLVSILAQHLNLKKLNLGFIDWNRLQASAKSGGQLR